MSIVTDRDGMFGSNGFYDANDKEKPASVEVIYADTPEMSEQVDGGVEGHSHIRMKRSLRLNFRKEIGAASFETDLFTKMPWNPPGVDSAGRADTACRQQPRLVARLVEGEMHILRETSSLGRRSWQLAATACAAHSSTSTSMGSTGGSTMSSSAPTNISPRDTSAAQRTIGSRATTGAR